MSETDPPPSNLVRSTRRIDVATTGDTNHRTDGEGPSSTKSVLEARRRTRILSDDRRERRRWFAGGLLTSAPLAYIPFVDETMSPIMTVLTAMFCLVPMLSPALIIGSFIPTKERRKLRRGVPTYIPPAPRLDDGTTGPEWSPERKDVLFGRLDRLIDAMARQAPAQDVDQMVASFSRRASELVEGRSVHRPVYGSPHHYWPNKCSTAGTHEGDTITSYDDNLPIDAQRMKLRTIRKEVARDLSSVEHGIDAESVVVSVLDLVAVVRRIVELSGYGPGPLRPDVERIASDGKPAVKLPSSIPASASTALKLVHQAVELDPDCTDGLGNRIEPLVDHVTRILKTHADASQMASDQERIELDAQLDEAMGFVAAAARQGMDLHHRGRLRKFGTDAAFIRMRHDPGPLALKPDET